MQYKEKRIFLPELEKVEVTNALQTVIILGRISGVHPYNKENNICSLWFIHTIFLVVYFTVGIVSCLGWLQYQDEEWFSSMYHLVLEKGQAVTIYTCFVASVATCIYYKNEIHGVIFDLQKIDYTLAVLGMPFRYSTKWIHTVLIFRVGSIIFVYALDMLILMTPSNWLTYMDNMTTYHPMFPTTAIQLVASSLLSFLSDHVRFLESRLLKTATAPQYEGQMKKIHVIGSCYIHCVKMSHLVNDIFSVHILLCAITIFYMNVVNIYNCVLIKSRDSHNKTALLFILVLCISLRGIELWNITQPYVDFIDKAESFQMTMYKLAIEDKSNYLINDEIYQSHISVHPGLTYTACGFFNVDYTLVQSMIGALVTFFVILLQLDVSTIE